MARLLMRHVSPPAVHRLDSLPHHAATRHHPTKAVHHSPDLARDEAQRPGLHQSAYAHNPLAEANDGTQDPSAEGTPTQGLGIANGATPVRQTSGGSCPGVGHAQRAAPAAQQVSCHPPVTGADGRIDGYLAPGSRMERRADSSILGAAAAPLAQLSPPYDRLHASPGPPSTVPPWLSSCSPSCSQGTCRCRGSSGDLSAPSTAPATESL